ncbi:hypothetical protein [Paenibacillus sp. DYY-L-2]|uniref:hypothetical protein n=1 Tax=Paenibacillus sp. DYY-L-2 TaxID=3447013 RepID=UPI003F4FE76E
MDKIVERFYEIKQAQKELEQELASLRQEILDYCGERNVTKLEVGGHEVKLVQQQRREYDEHKLYEALPDPELWRMLSKPDSSKIASLVKLKVIPDEKLKDTYTLKNITLVQVDKK